MLIIFPNLSFWLKIGNQQTAPVGYSKTFIPNIGFVNVTC